MYVTMVTAGRVTVTSFISNTPVAMDTRAVGMDTCAVIMDTCIVAMDTCAVAA